MIGDEYLRVRAQLETALLSLSSLAGSLHAGHGELQTLQDLSLGLHDPFLLVVAGETGSGKTSLINALFGSELFPAGLVSSPNMAYLFNYGPEEKRTVLEEGFMECRRPLPFLRDFNIVDTPGTGAIGAAPEAITDEILPRADLVLFVFSINNPWAVSAWNFLKLIDKKYLRNFIFVLQQSDLRGDAEVDPVVQHLEQKLHEKFRHGNRVFPVSAKKAWLARTTGTDKEGLLKQSNFPALESYIDDTVTRNEERISKLRTICQTAQIILRDTGGQVRSALSLINQDTSKLNELHHGIGERREQSMRQAGGIVWTLAQSYERLQKLGEQLLQEQLSFAGTRKSKSGSWQDKIRLAVDAELKDSIHRQIQSSVELLEADLQKAWQQLHESLRRRFSAEVGVTVPSDLIDERKELLAHIEFSIMANMSRQNFPQQIRDFFAATAQSLGIPAELLRIEGSKTVVTGLADWVISDFHNALVGNSTALPGSALAMVQRAKILAQFRTGMARKREELATTMENQMGHSTAAFYAKLDVTFRPLQKFCAAQKQVFDPHMAAVKQMDETFANAAATLGYPPVV